MSRKRIAIVGVGNILMGDEGFGVRVLEELSKIGLPDNVKLIDAGTGFFNIAASLEGFDKIIIVDVAKGGGEPGSVYRFKEQDINSDRGFSVSLHDFGVIESLNLERMVRKITDDVIFFGIEPYKIEMTMKLSEPIREKIGRVVKLIIEEIDRT